MESQQSEPKIALVTGGARRIGAQIVRSLHVAGWRVHLHYRNSASEAQALADELNQIRSESVTVWQADLLDVAAIRAMVRGVGESSGHLDLLVNNASSFYPTPVETATMDEWNDLFGSNLQAPFFLVQAALPLLRSVGGCVVNMVDIHAERPMPKHPIYSAAKSGLLAMTRSLAVELAPMVRVNAVAPGAILWPEHEASQTTQEALLARVPLQRLGSPEDIAKAVLFLAQDAPYVTGQVLAVDGGRSAVI